MSTIKNRIDFKDCDDHILSVLSDLESSDFYNNTIPELILFEESFRKMKDFDDKVLALETLKDKFKHCCEINKTFAIREANEIELFTLNKILENDALKVETREEFVEKTFKALYDEKLMELVPDETERKKIIDVLYSEHVLKDK